MANDLGSAGHEDDAFLYFAYGSNLSEQQLIDRVGAPSFTFAARLEDYQLRFTKKSKTGDPYAFANVEPAAGAATYGKVYGLSAKQLFDMDIYEGAPQHYVRRTLGVRVLDAVLDARSQVETPDSNHCNDRLLSTRGAIRACNVYVAAPEFHVAHPHPPRRGYLKKLLMGGPLIPRWYTQWLAKHDCVAD